MRSGRGSYGSPGEELYQTTMQLHRTTEKAALLSDDGEKDNAKWLPRSQLTMTPTKNRGEYTVTMPEWLAIKNGLV